MAGDFIPHREEHLNSWMERYVEYAQEHAAELGVSPSELSALVTAQARFGEDYQKHMDAQVAALSARCTKDDSRDDLIQIVRRVSRQIQANPSVTDGDRQSLGISVRTKPSRTEEWSPDEEPFGIIDFSGRMRHVIRIRSNTGESIQRRRPDGAIACEIWRSIGVAPETNGAGLHLVGVAMGSTYSIDYPMSDAGKLVYYVFRWINNKGQTGGWSPTQSASVAA